MAIRLLSVGYTCERQITWKCIMQEVSHQPRFVFSRTFTAVISELCSTLGGLPIRVDSLALPQGYASWGTSRPGAVYQVQ